MSAVGFPGRREADRVVSSSISSAIALTKSENDGNLTKEDAERGPGQMAELARVGLGEQESEEGRRSSFDPARLNPEYERKGWSPPGVTKGAIPGLEFLTKLSPDDRMALIAFLRSL